MPRHLHIQPIGALDASLLLGALVHLGASPAALEEELRRLVPGARLRAGPPGGAACSGIRAEVSPGREPLGAVPAHPWSDALAPRARERALAAVGALAGAGASPGAGEPLETLLACCLALDLLDVDAVTSEPLPVPEADAADASATLRLLVGVPIRGDRGPGGSLGPAGVALTTSLATSFGPVPSMVLEAVGLGLDASGEPGVRLFLGSSHGLEAPAENLVTLAANLDDLPAELLAPLLDVCLRAGALDAWLAPVLMKKGRPGQILHALCRPETEAAVSDAIFRESSTLGIRRTPVERLALERAWEEASTPWGVVRVKLGLLGGKVVNRAPEFEDCQRIAETHGVPLKEVYGRALAGAHWR